MYKGAHMYLDANQLRKKKENYLINEHGHGE